MTIKRKLNLINLWFSSNPIVSHDIITGEIHISITFDVFALNIDKHRKRRYFYYYLLSTVKLNVPDGLIFVICKF
jgi:hypothetical protein